MWNSYDIGLAPILVIWSQQITSYLRLNESWSQTLVCNAEIDRCELFRLILPLMFRIVLVSKNLLANCLRDFCKKDLKKTAIRKV